MLESDDTQSLHPAKNRTSLHRIDATPLSEVPLLGKERVTCCALSVSGSAGTVAFVGTDTGMCGACCMLLHVLLSRCMLVAFVSVSNVERVNVVFLLRLSVNSSGQDVFCSNQCRALCGWLYLRLSCLVRLLSV